MATSLCYMQDEVEIFK